MKFKIGETVKFADINATRAVAGDNAYHGWFMESSGKILDVNEQYQEYHVSFNNKNIPYARPGGERNITLYCFEKYLVLKSEEARKIRGHRMTSVFSDEWGKPANLKLKSRALEKIYQKTW